jgi:hypothetical protein
MMRPGGLGILPLQKGLDDQHGLLPNRQLVFWPYTDINSSNLCMHNLGIGVQATMEEGAVKIGAPNPLNWLAYAWGGLLFVKRAGYQWGAKYLDRGASSQIYCSPEMIELETLGPVVNLAPGESVDHQEIWQVYPEGKWPREISDLSQIIMGTDSR